MKKKSILIALALGLGISSASYLGVNNVFATDVEPLSKEAKEKVKESWEINDEVFYDYIPEKLLKKHASTIEAVDNILEERGIDFTSKSVNFNLNYYVRLVQLEVFTSLSKEDPIYNDVRKLGNDIGKLIVKGQKKKSDEIDAETVFNGVGDKKDKEETVESLIDFNGYNVTDAIDYAHTWTKNGTELRNSNYDYYDGKNDCTNFVSQVVYEGGGMSQIRNDNFGYDYDDVDNWYYEDSFNNPPSWTWGGAHNFYEHLRDHSSNVKRIYSTSDLELGDIVSWDTFDDGEFHIGHTVVVTKIESGKIYVTYHTTDKEDEPIDTLFNAGYKAYAWDLD
ncbi:amidase domain-containing protein [Bacillus sp. SM2101]|uniref:amidase domain-containing protein n=1 Tax=Bacillus sp. SM2101 TaxID=2805366 RepID=UPI001BDE4FB3